MAVATTPVSRTADPGARAGWEAPSAAALTWLTVGAAFLALGGLLMVVTAAQQVAPGLLTTGAGTSIGRLRPAAVTLVVFGGIGMLGTGAAIDVARRLSRAPVQLELVAKVAGALTTAAVALGAGAIVLGHSTGRAGLELPRVFAVPLALGLLAAAVVIVRTVAARDRDDVHPALWFVSTAAVAGPVILLLGTLPRVAGVNDEIVLAFAVSGLGLMWLLPLGIGLALYVVPAGARAPLHSRALATTAFWGWLAFAPFAGPVRLLSGPAQEWLESIGAAATIALLVPLLAIVTLLLSTYARRTSLAHSAELKVALAGTALLLLAVPVFAVAASRTAGDLLHASVAAEGAAELVLVIAAAFAVAGALHVTPALTGNRLANPRVAGVLTWFVALGAATVVLSLLVAGYVQGALWSAGVENGTPTFTGAGWQVVTDMTRPLLWVRVAGEALLATAWIAAFQQILSTTAYGEPLAAPTTEPGSSPARA